MVTITNGINTFRVTAGAVKPYKSMGFHVVSDIELEEMKQLVHESVDNSVESGSTLRKSNHNAGRVIDYGRDKEDNVNDEDTAFVEELLEKPLSQWSSEEIKDFVKIKGIDTSGAQKMSQVRGIIKSYLEGEQKRNV